MLELLADSQRPFGAFGGEGGVHEHAELRIALGLRGGIHRIALRVVLLIVIDLAVHGLDGHDGRELFGIHGVDLGRGDDLDLLEHILHGRALDGLHLDRVDVHLAAGRCRRDQIRDGELRGHDALRVIVGEVGLDGVVGDFCDLLDVFGLDMMLVYHADGRFDRAVAGEQGRIELGQIVEDLPCFAQTLVELLKLRLFAAVGVAVAVRMLEREGMRSRAALCGPAAEKAVKGSLAGVHAAVGRAGVKIGKQAADTRARKAHGADDAVDAAAEHLCGHCSRSDGRMRAGAVPAGRIVGRHDAHADADRKLKADDRRKDQVLAGAAELFDGRKRRGNGACTRVAEGCFVRVVKVKTMGQRRVRHGSEARGHLFAGDDRGGCGAAAIVLDGLPDGLGVAGVDMRRADGNGQRVHDHILRGFDDLCRKVFIFQIVYKLGNVFGSCHNAKLLFSFPSSVNDDNRSWLVRP